MYGVIYLIYFILLYPFFHSYLLYPFFLYLFSFRRGKSKPEVRISDYPELTIICAAFNEEKVIAQKIHSTFLSDYPKEKLRLLIGTDACTDHTVQIITELAKQYPGLQCIEFSDRTGKIGVLNALYRQAKSEILVMTDANVFFNPQTLTELLPPFDDKLVNMVCGKISKRPLDTLSVTQTELKYMNFENFLKQAESTLWELVFGAEGGCYAIRSSSFREIPVHFIADDFFLTCEVLKTGGKIIYASKAQAFEDLSGTVRSEFMRKVRIGTGNFQNLFRFKALMVSRRRGLAFAFVSHKVFRWITPLLYSIGLVGAFLLGIWGYANPFLFWGMVAPCFIPFLNFIIEKLGWKNKFLGAVNHLFWMNIALIFGFMNYLRGVKSSVWSRTERQ